MPALIVDKELLDQYLRFTPPPPTVSDAELESWGEFYRATPEINNYHCFDVFIGNPRRYCVEAGVLPVPHFNSVMEDSEDIRRLNRKQRVVAANIPFMLKRQAD